MEFFSDEEIGQQAAENQAAIFLVTVKYLRAEGIDPDGWAQYLGSAFAPTWDDMRDAPAHELVKFMARNIVSMGGSLERIEGDAHRATGSVTWPPADLLDEFGATKEDADRVWDLYDPIAEHLGVDFEWHRSGAAVELRVSLRR